MKKEEKRNEAWTDILGGSYFVTDIKLSILPAKYPGVDTRFLSSVKSLRIVQL